MDVLGSLSGQLCLANPNMVGFNYVTETLRLIYSVCSSSELTHTEKSTSDSF